MAKIKDLDLNEYMILVRDNERLRIEKNKYLDILAQIDELIMSTMNKYLEEHHRNWMRLSEVKVTDLMRIMDMDYDTLEAQLIDTYEATHGEPATHVDGGYQE